MKKAYSKVITKATSTALAATLTLWAIPAAAFAEVTEEDATAPETAPVVIVEEETEDPADTVIVSPAPDDEMDEVVEKTDPDPNVKPNPSEDADDQTEEVDNPKDKAPEKDNPVDPDPWKDPDAETELPPNCATTGQPWLVAGGHQSWYLAGGNKTAGLQFRTSGVFSTFEGVSIDGKTLASGTAYYAHAGKPTYNGGGSDDTVVKILPAVLDTLTAEKHTVTIHSGLGNVNIDLKIFEGENPDAENGGLEDFPQVIDLPVTGDDEPATDATDNDSTAASDDVENSTLAETGDNMLMVAIPLVALAGIAGVGAIASRKRMNVEDSE